MHSLAHSGLTVALSTLAYRICSLCVFLCCVCYCVVVEYNALPVPTFQSPVFTGLVANVLCMYTVLRVLPCYRIVLPCYRCSVTEVLNHSSGFRISVYQCENGMHRDAIWLLAIGYWVLSLPSPSQLGFARVYYRACACMCARVYSRVRAWCVRITHDP